MFGSKMMSSADPSIIGEISDVRFRRAISGYADCPLGGGRARRVLKSLKSGRKVKRILSATCEILPWIRNEVWGAGPVSGERTEFTCAISIGFFPPTSY